VQIDWLTVGAQIVNFLILVALLRRFLYRPVLEAMARREARIARRLTDAAERERDAETRARELRERSDAIERRRDELVDQAREEADAERRRLHRDAHAELEQERAQWRAAMAREWEDVRQQVTRCLADTVTEATRRALADLADTSLEQAMARLFRRRLSELGATERAAMAASDAVLEIVTAFEPDDATRTSLAAAVQEQLGRPVRFTRADDLVAGIELRAEGWKLSWTVAEHLRGLEDLVRETLAAPDGRNTRADMPC